MGYVEFYRRRFTVDGRCLIPRPETEYMIEGVCDHISQQPTTSDVQRVLIDVGTWCGVLGTSVLLENPGYFNRAYLTEYFEDTLSLAKENVSTYKKDIGGQTDVQLIKADLVDFLAHEPAHSQVSVQDEIILIANLPYIPDETFDTQTEDNVRKWEPRPAFVGGEDGLDYYRQMFAQIEARYETGLLRDTTQESANWHNIQSTYNETGLMKINMFLEMMTRQVDILRREFGDRMQFDEIKTFHFNIRIVQAVRTSKGT